MDALTAHNTALNSSMGIGMTTYRIRIGRFGPGMGYFSTGIAEIYSSSITGSDFHYRMLATMVLLTFLLKCCVITQQERIVQDVYTFAGTDQCQLPESGPYNYIRKSTYRIRAVHSSKCFGLVWFSFTALQHIYVISGAVTLTTLFLGKPPRQFTST